MCHLVPKFRRSEHAEISLGMSRLQFQMVGSNVVDGILGLADHDIEVTIFAEEFNPFLGRVRKAVGELGYCSFPKQDFSSCLKPDHGTGEWNSVV